MASRHPAQKGDRVSREPQQDLEQRSDQSSAVTISAVTITVVVIAGDVSDNVVGSASSNTLSVSSRVEDLLSERLPFQHNFYFHQKAHFSLPLTW